MHRAVQSNYGQGYGNFNLSKNSIAKILKVTAMTRNWATMKKLLEIAAWGESDPPHRLR
jgi:hypothetical protein